MNDQDVNINGLVSLIKQGDFEYVVLSLNSLIDEKNYELYSDWIMTASNDERDLRSRAIDFENKYFTDLILEDSITELTAFEDLASGKSFTGDITEPELLQISNGWRFAIINNTNSFGGRCKANENKYLSIGIFIYI